MTTAYNRPPYFDDFKVEDNNLGGKTVAEKNYHRILFNPAYPVQTRELNQLQTMLQHQIEQFGSSIFKDGTPIIDGIATFNDNTPYIDIQLTQTDVENNFSSIKFIESRDVTTEVTEIAAEVLNIEQIDTGYRLWLRYTRGGNSSNRFSNETLYLKNDILKLEELNDIVLGGSDTSIGTVLDAGYGFSLHCEAGVYFIKGCFVHTIQQDEYFIKSSKVETITGESIFAIEETITTSADDPTLLDNANGAPNYAAPGADRYTIRLILGLKTSDSDILNLNDSNVYDSESITSDYITLLKITGSEVAKPSRTRLSELGDILAQRTYEESGNYTVNPFLIKMREFLNDENGNGGRYTETQITTNNPFGITNTNDAEANMVVEIDPSVAYIEGYRVELANKLTIPIEKPRTFDTITNNNIVALRGNYIDVVYDPTNGTVPTAEDLYNYSISPTDKILNVEFVSVISATEPEGQYNGGARAGWLRYRFYIHNNFDNSIAPDQSTNLPDGFEFRYLPGTMGGSSAVFDNSIKDSDKKSALYILPYESVREVNTVEYTKSKRFNGAEATLLEYNFSSASNESFEGVSRNEILIYNKTTGLWVDGSTAIDVVSNGNDLNVVFNSGQGISGGDDIDIICPVRVTDGSNLGSGSNRRTKSLTSVIDETLNVSNGVVIIPNQDVIMSSISAENDQSFTIISDGQNGSFYDSPILRLEPGENDITLSYDYFDHGSGDYFDRNTYDSIADENVTVFQGRRLSDFIDFRVKRTNNGDGTYDLVSEPARVVPNSVIVMDFKYYLPRIDSLIVDSKGEFSLKKGIPQVPPEAPNTPNGTMKLYEIDIPAYVYDINTVGYSYVDNKRYRMKDIAKLEKRIQSLEYYSSLSLLEKEANDKKILDLSEDNAGVERFKNGILVDSFLGHNVGDPRNPDYLCSIDRKKQILRPYYTQKNFRAKYTGTPDNYVGVESLSLDEGTREVLHENLTASQSMSVQPYEITVWEGSIKLSPSSDEWIDTNTSPGVTLNLNGFSDAIEALANNAGLENGVIGTEWNAWQNNWRSTSTSTSASTSPPHSERAPDGIMRRSTVETNTTTTTSGQTRTGTRSTLGFTQIEQDLGDRVVDVSFIPWIRSRDIYFRGTGFKPRTKVYAFFDGENVSDYCKMTSTFVLFGENEDIETYNGDSAPGGDFDNDLITDDAGEIIGVFRIPNNSDLRFRTGTRDFELSDNEENNSLESDTLGTSHYTASGMLQEMESTILSTRAPEIGTESVSQERIVRTSSSTSRTTWHDPVAQTFFIDDNHPNGAFLSDIDLFFATKPDDPNVSVEIYLVSVENGTPTTKVVPGTKVRKRGSEINVTGRNIDEGDPITNHPTKFEFDIPVYLKPGTEYALVIFSPSPDYRIWTSEIGKTDLNTGSPIIKNPAFGVLQKSQNKRTWTAEQTKDIMLKLNKIVFPTNLEKSFEFKTISGQDIGEFNFSLFNLAFENVNFPKTSLSFDVQFFDSNDNELNSLTEFRSCENNVNYELREQIGTAAGDNAVDYMKVTVNMITTDRDLSPIVDLDRTSILGISNYVNSPQPLNEGGEYNKVNQEFEFPVANGGDIFSKYITKKVELANPAEDLRVITALNRPSNNCSVRVFAKRKPAASEDVSFENDVDWYEMQIYSVDNNANNTTLPIDKNENYTEVEWILPTADPNFVDVIDEKGYTEFAIKICFISDDVTKIVKIKDLRAIASI